jgi:hypothetical protein
LTPKDVKGCLAGLLRLVLKAVAGIMVLIGAASGYKTFIAHKAVEFRFIGRSPYLNPLAGPPKDLKLYFRDKPVVSPYATLVKISNVGTDAITVDDYDIARPITLDFAVPVLNAEVVAKSPDDLMVSCWPEGHKAVIKPSLLNPDDEFTVSVLSDGDGGWPAPSCRVVNGRKPYVAFPHDKPRASWWRYWPF